MTNYNIRRLLIEILQYKLKPVYVKLKQIYTHVLVYDERTPQRQWRSSSSHLKLCDGQLPFVIILLSCIA